jgi:chromate transporter
MAASVPGPLAISTAWLLGRHYRGLKGSLAAVAGAVLPSLPYRPRPHLGQLAYSDEPRIQGFFKGVLAGTGAIITTVVFDNVRSTLMSGWWNVVPFAVVVVLIGLFGVHPLISMLAAFSLQMIRERLTER